MVCFFWGPLAADLKHVPPKPPLNKTKAKNFIREIVRILQTEDIDCLLKWNFYTGVLANKTKFTPKERL